MGSKLFPCIMDIPINVSVLTPISIPVKSGSAQHARVGTSSLPSWARQEHRDPHGVPRGAGTPGFEATCLASFSPLLRFPTRKASRKLPPPGAAWPLPTTRKEDVTKRSLTVSSAEEPCGNPRCSAEVGRAGGGPPLSIPSDAPVLRQEPVNKP